jgi:hypothetical protein
MISLQWRGQSNPRRGVVNKQYLVKLSKQERKELSQLVKKERIAAKKRHLFHRFDPRTHRPPTPFM